MRPLASASAILAASATILLPPPDMTVSQWAEEYRILSREDSARPGKWSNEARPYQTAIMDAASTPRIQYITVVGPAQWGKALSLDTPIPTPTGWTTMGEVSPGDLILGRGGQEVRVVGQSEVFIGRPCYRVAFDDGSSIVADEEHLWYTEATRGGGAVRSTAQIVASLKVNGRSNHAIPLARPLKGNGKELPIPPYTFGAWLGDGDSDAGAITFGEDGREVLRQIARDGIGVTVVKEPIKGRGGRASLGARPSEFCLRGHQKNGQVTCPVCNLQRYHFRKHGRPMDDLIQPTFRATLASLGLIKRKHIPLVYLRSTMHSRLALLQGLMDTDGYIRSGGAQCEFTTTSEELAKGVIELVLSLGLKGRMSQGRATLYGKDCGPKWRIIFQAYDDFPVFRLPYKLGRMRPRSLGRAWKTQRRYIVAVESVPSVPVKCIAVDSPDRLYLAGRSMIPTHNTQILNNILGSRIHLNPGPMMVVNATERASEKWSKTRFTPMVRDCLQLAALIGDPKSRDSSNTILEKTFPGGLLVAVGANAPAGLASQPIRDLFLDEIDRIPLDESAGEEGDFEDLAEARTADFEGRRLIYRCSTPTIKTRSRIEKSFQESDQRYRFWTCPHCGHEQTYNFRSVVFSEAGKPEDAIYACAGSGCVITQHELTQAERAGTWRATRPEVLDHAGFYVHGLMVRSMATLVKGFLKAKHKGPKSLQVFINTQLGEWWDMREGETLQAEGLLARAREEDYLSGEVPTGVGILCASVDNQSGTPQRLEILVRGTGAAEEKWTILHHVIPGNLAVTQSTEDIDSPWDRLEMFLLQEWRRKDGGTMRIRCIALDIGGHFTKQVYAFCRRPRMRGIAFPIKGATTPQAKLVRKSNTKGRLYLVDQVAAKDQLYAELKIPKPGPGYQHFPSDTDQGYFEQLLAEVPVRNKRKYEKRDKDDPNEILDLHVYHDAALAIYAPRDLAALVAKAQGGGPTPPVPTPEVDDMPEPEEIQAIPEAAPPTQSGAPRRILPKIQQRTTAAQAAPVLPIIPKPSGSGAW